MAESIALWLGLGIGTYVTACLKTKFDPSKYSWMDLARGFSLAFFLPPVAWWIIWVIRDEDANG